MLSGTSVTLPVGLLTLTVLGASTSATMSGSVFSSTPATMSSRVGVGSPPDAVRSSVVVAFLTAMSASRSGSVDELDEGRRVVDEPAVLRLRQNGDEVVLPQRGQRAVDGHGCLGGDAVGDLTHGAPGGLRPVAEVAVDLRGGGVDAVAEVRLATEQLAA